MHPYSAWSLGVRIPNQDASAIARGNAFVATADNPSATYYNPAGISRLPGHNLQVGSILYLNIYTDYEGRTGTAVDNDEEVIPVPQLHYAFTPKNLPLSFGLGLYAPFGLSMGWPEDAPFRSGGIEAQLNCLTINPVVAWRVRPNFSLAAGPTFNHSKLNLVQGLNLVPNDEFEFDGENWGYGFNLGALWQPHPRWSLGVSYRSQSRVDYQGEASFTPSPPLPASSDTSAKFDFPQILIAGISFRPTTNWNLEFNVDWADWSLVEALAIKGFPKQTLDWHASFFYEVGVTRYLPKGYFISAGYFFSEASTSDKYFTPLVPDTDLHVGSLGGGRRGKHWQWALAGQIIAGDWRKAENRDNPTVNGRYRLLTPTVSFSVGYRF
jgi:long-chain fatty acid transport protein